MTNPGPYPQRQSRTAQHLAAFPHAAEMLGLYREVLTRQEPLYRWALDAHGLAPTEPPEPPRLGLGKLPFADLADPFGTFVGELTAVVPPPLAAAGEALAAAPDALRAELLATAVAQGSLTATATALGCEVPHLAFYSRAFLEPLAEALAARDPQKLEGGRGTCERCGWPPQVSVLRDEPETKGRRYLVCALCASWWIFTRSVCPNCGEKEAEKLPIHEAEGKTHLRIEECATCKAYVKSVDLRKDGFAVPVVDDLASVELDLWCEEKGLWKLSRNLLGM